MPSPDTATASSAASPTTTAASEHILKPAIWAERVSWVLFWGIHVGCLAAIWTGVSVKSLVIAFVLYWVRMFAITGGYHRYFSHKTYKTSRGVVLPAPMNLVGRYDGQTIEIELRTDGFWWEGKRYTDPSSVAVDVKKSLGASDTTASTNGWKFWCVGNRDTQGAVPLDNLRQAWLNSEVKRMSEWKRQQAANGS